MATDGKGEVIKINQKCISDLLSGKKFHDENFIIEQIHLVANSTG